ncbi:MAG TPA: c-type cytochrome, partial [Thermomicrobiales bacterium]|nr:c-type cytochrome [Thermomicrobiales bacterium]
SLVVIYLFNEPHRRSSAEEDKLTESIDRGMAIYSQFCVECHGPDGSAQGRRGIPLNVALNQATGPEWDQREPVLRKTIERGGPTIMPAWGEADGGPLTDQQVTDVLNMIHSGNWEEINAYVLRQYGGTAPTPPPVPTSSASPVTDPLAQQGQQIYQQQCAACHSTDGTPMTGPSWKGLYGHEVTLEDGSTVTADDAYIHESILTPTAKIVQGFPPAMPPFQLSDDEINAIIAFIKTLQ